MVGGIRKATETASQRTALQTVGLLAGPIVFAALLAGPAIDGLAPVAQRALAITAWVAIWWMTEPIAANVTALLPFALFPALGVIPARDAARAYQHDVIFLFLGGLLLAVALERAGLHHRMAAAMVRAFGRRPRAFMAGYYATVAFVSYFMSNVATTLLFLPSALALSADVRLANPGRDTSRFAIALVLGTGLAASIGGMATPVGTAPNLILVGQAGGIPFFSWLKVGVPLSLALVAVLYVTTTWVTCRYPRDLALPGGGSAVARERWTAAQILVAVVFAMTVFGWAFRTDVDLGPLGRITGWSTLFERVGLLPSGARGFITDGSVAVIAALILFILPARRKGEPILDAQALEQLPWGILVLLGSSFVLAEAFDVPKGGAGSLSSWLANGLSGLQSLPLPVELLIMALAITFAGELASNTAMAALLVPIGFAMAHQSGMNPLVYGYTISLAASCSFMLPVATPPNTLVYGTRLVPLRHMLATGIVLDVAGACAVAALVAWLV